MNQNQKIDNHQNKPRTKEQLIADVTKSLKLTQWGEKRLQSFTVDALSDASHVEYHSFNEFVSNCIRHSKENNLRIDWQNYYQVARDMPKGQSWVDTPVHRQTSSYGSSVSFVPKGNSAKIAPRAHSQKGEIDQVSYQIYSQEQKRSIVTRHEPPVKHDSPSVTPHFMDFRFWGPKR